MRITLLCLHGWGGTKESFTELRQSLSELNADIEILAPDLPGFGKEPEPPEPWSVDNYAKWVEEWTKANVKDADNLHLLGHSHGGRISIKLAAKGNLRITHLYLCAAAGIRRTKHIKRIVGLLLAKGGKMLTAMPGLKTLAPLGKKLLYSLLKSHDYENASPIMRQTLIRVSSEDLRPLLSQIKIPTDIFWGTEDRMTPLKDGKIMHENIAGSELHVYPGIRHRVHRDRAREIAATVVQRISRSASSS